MARHTRIPMYLDAIVRHHRFAPRSCKVAESCMRIRQGKVMRLGMLWQERESRRSFYLCCFCCVLRRSVGCTPLVSSQHAP